MTWVDLFPVIFFPLKIIVLGVGMFFSIKWHHDQDKKKKNEADRRNGVSVPQDAGMRTTPAID
ncbi:hypothetical protein [Caulobacter zeae]|uniref:hypothetical protein n=1 Tax=Caulobacter zeae TaxID=2055137 RepID=UPI00196A419D|nr:hypothetical protein [Caulobacter zeae]